MTNVTLEMKFQLQDDKLNYCKVASINTSQLEACFILKMATISILANPVRPSVDRRLDDATFGAGTFSWKDPVHSWKSGPGEVMTMEKTKNF